MSYLSTEFLMHAEKITLTNGETIENKDIFIYDPFLVIGEGEGANWINLAFIESMQGVTIIGRMNKGARLG